MGIVGGLWTGILDAWPQIVAVLHIVFALVASSHAVLTKEDPKSAIAWVGLIWLSPFIGVALYYVLGINRIRRKAIAIMGEDQSKALPPDSHSVLMRSEIYAPSALYIAAIGDRLKGFPLVEGNDVSILENGDEAYPEMLTAIEAATVSVMLSSYIFDYDEAGLRFLHALARAVRRGVEVRVLIDATGSRYSVPSIVPALKNVGIRTARFMPNLSLSSMSAINLRSHRKILVIDGRLGFTGGMNIRAGNYIKKPMVKKLIQDVHFRLSGPVVAHLRRAFIEDWAFTTKEVLEGSKWVPELESMGQVLARGVLDGPDKDFEKILDTLYAAINGARRSIKIVTPYFLPDPTTIKFLTVAARSGVDVEVVLPEENNIPLVYWASISILRPLIESGCRIFFSQPPFDHSKIMVVDEVWSFLGSANWDARSLRLNFEFNVECYSSDFAQKLLSIFEKKRARSRPVTLEEIKSRKLPLRLRDGLVKLLAPYL